MYGDFPAKNTVYTPYIPINVWFWSLVIRIGGRCRSMGVGYVMTVGMANHTCTKRRLTSSGG
jgi:hypothetical protein